MIAIYTANTGEHLGTIPKDQLRILFYTLEEESIDDNGYYINQETIRLLQAMGLNNEACTILQRAIATNSEAGIRWEKA